MQKSRLTYFSAIVLTAVLLAGCSDKPVDQSEDDTPETSGPATVKVAARSHVVHVNLPGGAKIEGYESARLYAKISGYVRDVRRIARGEIQPVEKGGKVVKIQIRDSLVEGRPIDIIVILVEAGGRTTRFAAPNRDAELALETPARLADEKESAEKKDAKKEPEYVRTLRKRAEQFLQELYSSDEPPVEIDIGTEVEAGTVLAVLHVPEMVAELAEKRAALTEASQERNEKDALAKFYAANYKDYQALKKSGATTKELLDKAEAENEAAIAAVKTAAARIETAKANVNVAQAMAGYAKITAPFSGRITGRMVHRGTFIRSASKNSNAQPLFDIARFDKVRVIASVPGSLAPLVVLGKAEADLHSLNGYPGAIIDLGKVTRSAISLDPDSHAMRVEIDVDNPADVIDADTREKTGDKIELKHGMFGTLSLTTGRWDEKNNPLSVVPVTAVGTDDSRRSYVIAAVEGKDGEYEKRRIRIIFNNAIEVGFELIGDKKIEEVLLQYDANLAP